MQFFPLKLEFKSDYVRHTKGLVFEKKLVYRKYSDYRTNSFSNLILGLDLVRQLQCSTLVCLVNKDSIIMYRPILT